MKVIINPGASWIRAELAFCEEEKILWLDARCDFCGSECVRTHKTAFGYIFQCLDCKQEEEALENGEIAVRGWRR